VRTCLFGGRLKFKAQAAQNEQGARAREPPQHSIYPGFISWSWASAILSHIPRSAVVVYVVGVGGAVVVLFVFVVLFAMLCFPLDLDLGLG
jgi:hypothetical protein